MGWTHSTHGDEEKLIQNFYKTPEGKNRFVRPRSRWDDDPKADLIDISV
jgi:hypothetical protein